MSQQCTVESIDLSRCEQRAHFTLEALLNGVERQPARCRSTAILVSPRDLKISVVHHRPQLKNLVIIEFEKFSKPLDGEFRILDWSLFRRFLWLRRPFRSRRPWLLLPLLLMFGLLGQNRR